MYKPIMKQDMMSQLTCPLGRARDWTRPASVWPVPGFSYLSITMNFEDMVPKFHLANCLAVQVVSVVDPHTLCHSRHCRLRTVTLQRKLPFRGQRRYVKWIQESQHFAVINMLLIFYLHLLCKAYYAFHIPRRGLTSAIRGLRNLTYQKAGNL